MRPHSTAEIEHRVHLHDGRTLGCLELGDPAGPPVLYFHGYPGSRLEARVGAIAAGQLGLRLLAVDRPGFGQSTFQRGRTVGGWAVDVEALADQLSLSRFSIIGVSGGGPYALACAVVGRADDYVISPLRWARITRCIRSRTSSLVSR